MSYPWIPLLQRRNYNDLLLEGAPEPIRDGKEAGVLLAITDSGERQTAGTLQCVHCGKHWVPVKHSGRIRGFCRDKCFGPICGKRECMEKCVPYEKRLDIQDGLVKADSVSVACAGLVSGSK